MDRRLAVCQLHRRPDCGSHRAGGRNLRAHQDQADRGGVKVDFSALTSTLGLFQIKQPSGLTTVDNGVTGYDMSGEQRNRGVEFNASGELARGVRLLGGIIYIQPTMLRIAKPETDGNSPSACRAGWPISAWSGIRRLRPGLP